MLAVNQPLTRESVVEMDTNVIKKNHNMRDMQEISLIEEIKTEIECKRISEAKLARESGLPIHTITLWLNGRYSGKDIMAVETSLSDWLRSNRMQPNILEDLNAIPSWLPTPTAKRILQALSYAHKFNDISVLYGGPGLGKTVTANHYQDDNQDVWIATMTASVNSVCACLERVAQALGLASIPTSASRIEQAIIHRIKGIQGLLIIDEAQHLSLPCLDALRGIYDACSIGMAIMGNESVYGQLTGGSRKAQFAQLFSRVGKRECFTKPENGDIDALLDAWGIKDTKARTMCREIGVKAGALRGLTKTLRMARLMIPDGESVISYELVKFAWTELGGMA